MHTSLASTYPSSSTHARFDREASFGSSHPRPHPEFRSTLSFGSTHSRTEKESKLESSQQPNKARRAKSEPIGGSKEDEDAVDFFRRFLLSQYGSAKEAFKKIDLNGNGEISLSELSHALSQFPLNTVTGGTDLRSLFKLMDLDNGGEITFYELMLTTRSMRKQAMAKKERGLKFQDEVDRFRHFMETHFGTREAAFKALDKDGNGSLSFSEVKKGLKRIGVNASEASGCKDLSVLFKMMDMGKGELNYHAMFETTPKQRKMKDRQPSIIETDKQLVSRKSRSSIRNSLVLTPEEAALVQESSESESSSEDEPDSAAEITSLWLLKIEAFANDVSMKDLDLRNGCIGELGARRLARAIQRPRAQRAIGTMELSNNYINTAGLLALASAIESRCSLQKLYLQWNGIGDEGAIRLARTVMKVQSLKVLNLANNRIGNEGAEALGFAVKRLKLSKKKEKSKVALKMLDLSSNLIGDAGISNIIEVSGKDITIKVEHNLQSNVGVCRVDEEAAALKESYSVLPLLSSREEGQMHSEEQRSRPSKQASEAQLTLAQVFRLPNNVPGDRRPSWPAAKRLDRALSEAILSGRGESPKHPQFYQEDTSRPSTRQLEMRLSKIGLNTRIGRRIGKRG